jgi:hypothetical protein
LNEEANIGNMNRNLIQSCDPVISHFEKTARNGIVKISSIRWINGENALLSVKRGILGKLKIRRKYENQPEVATLFDFFCWYTPWK